jgi:hypothetical protein
MIELMPCLYRIPFLVDKFNKISAEILTTELRKCEGGPTRPIGK